MGQNGKVKSKTIFRKEAGLSVKNKWRKRKEKNKWHSKKK